MPNIAQLRESKFLKKEDCGNGILLTIKEVFQQNVAKEGAPEELKWCVGFDETDKPLVLNSGNAQMIAQITGNDETEGWPGHKIVAYNEPSVMYAGKVIGGIRVRAPRTVAQTPRAAAPAPGAPAARKPAPANGQAFQTEGAADQDVPF